MLRLFAKCQGGHTTLNVLEKSCHFLAALRKFSKYSFEIFGIWCTWSLKVLEKSLYSSPQIVATLTCTCWFEI